MVAIVAAGIGGLSLMRGTAPETEKVELRNEPELVVETAVASLGAHRPRFRAVGMVEARAAADLYSPLETEVLALPWDEGEQVAKGESIIELDLRETRFQLEIKQAKLDGINVQIEAIARDRKTENLRLLEEVELQAIAQDEFERTVQLRERSVVSESAVQRMRTDLGQRELAILNQIQKMDALILAEKRLQVARRTAIAELGQIRLILERARLAAPFAGTITSVKTTAGARVQRGVLLAQIYDPSSLRLRAPIPSSVAGAGSQIFGVLVDGTERRNIDLIAMAPMANKGTGSVDVLFALPEDDWLLGEALELELVMPPVEGTVALPFDSLYGASRIYLVGSDGRAKAIECSLHGQTSVASEIVALLRCPGLENGAKVVANRIPSMISGAKLRLAEGELAESN